jgi:hypothetical protein
MSYFPIRILEVKSGKSYVVNSPEEIPAGVTFKVLECNVVDEPVIIQRQYEN